MSEENKEQRVDIPHAEEQGGGRGETRQFLTFAVDQAEYGVDIMSVREIKGWESTTRIPNSPDYMRGVMNLRGLVIPIFDLRTRFGMGRTEATEKHVVIVLAVGKRIIGILVDAVSDILTVSSNEIKAPPSSGEAGVDDAYINGLISVTREDDAISEEEEEQKADENKMVVLLDVEYLFDSETLDRAEKVAV